MRRARTVVRRRKVARPRGRVCPLGSTQSVGWYRRLYPTPKVGRIYPTPKVR